MPKAFLIAFVALLIIIPGSFLVYRFVFLKTTSPSPQTTTPQTTTPQTTKAPEKKTSGLTADESFVLSNILEEKTEKEKNVFQIHLSKAAIESEQLTIGNCLPTPVVWNLKIKKDLVVKNNDQVPHTITIYASKYKIPANGTINIPDDFLERGRMYPYSCDDVSVAGVLWLPK